MEDSEKLTALKKVYADIILNTAKEAAARIMVSEKKAMRFQHELVSTKDEALRMLLRLKQMSDSKVKEAELMSLTQQRKIDELEAQLQEAEEIVRDLRAELREVQDELENVEKHRMHPSVDHNIEGEIAAQENILKDNRLNPYYWSVNSASGLQFESVSISDTRNPTVNGINGSSNFCVSHDHTNNCYVHNPDFASIVIRRKEPKLYKNGCTQRIRAFEKILFYGNMPASGNSDNLQGETLVRVHEEGKVMPVTTDVKADDVCEQVKQDELKVVKENTDHAKIPSSRKRRKSLRRWSILDGPCFDKFKDTSKASDLDTQRLLDNNDPSMMNSSTINENEAQKDLMSPPLVKVPPKNKDGKVMLVTTDAKTDNICESVKTDELKVVKENAGHAEIPCHRKKEKYLQRQTLQDGLYYDKVEEINEASDLDIPQLLDNNDASRANSSTLNENEAQKGLMPAPFSEVPTDASATIEQSGSHIDIEKRDVLLKACNAQNKIKDGKELLDKSELTSEESFSYKSLEVPAFRTDVGVANESPNKLDLKVSVSDEKVSFQSVNDKFLKYTFRRKRKKESVGSADVDRSLEDSSLKKQCVEKQNGNVEPQKSCTMTESSWDSHRLAQVARQLISLSEKKWW